MYNACNDLISNSILHVNGKMSDLNSAINSDKRITDSDCYKKLAHNHGELNALLTHSVEYTESDQFHDRYWDRVEEADAVKEYAESSERHIRYNWHKHDFILHYDQCLKMLNEEQCEHLDEILDDRQEAQEYWED